MKARIDPPKIHPLPDDGKARPFWSVMIPTYNARADYLEETLRSVLRQDTGPEQMQIEVVDDCSPSGAPVVSTSVGSEGMPLRNGEELLVRDNALQFAEAAVQLARNPELWTRLAVAGRDAISRCYSPEKVRQRRNEIYATLKKG
jgi:cellulose synthase/poly-beta-1,6-N-acetylglucosamine synthase-like glycosyltransferase